MAARKKTPADVVIEELGIRPLARALDRNPTTVLRWRDSGLVPSTYHADILKLAAKQGKTLTADDLVLGR